MEPSWRWRTYACDHGTRPVSVSIAYRIAGHLPALRTARFAANVEPGPHGRRRLEPAAVGDRSTRRDAFEERVGAHPIGNVRVAQHFDRVLELVADRRHERAIQSARVHLDPEDAKGTGDLDS